MTEKQLNERIARAMDHAAPDELDAVLSRCGAQKGNVYSMTTMKKKRPLARHLIAACLALTLVGGGGIFYNQSYAVASVVSLDVNPSIELKVNKAEKVLSAAPLNAEAREVLAEMDGGADLKGTKLDVAVNAVVGALLRSGYLDDLSSAILISVEDKDGQRAAQLREELTATVDDVLREGEAKAAVLSQTVAKDSSLEKKAAANGISTGKAALVESVLAKNGKLDFAALAALSVEELRDLAAMGAPAMPIGRDGAAAAARKAAGVGESVPCEVDAELDEKPAHYDVELFTEGGEIEYEIDAFSAKILSTEYDDYDDDRYDVDDRYDDDDDFDDLYDDDDDAFDDDRYDDDDDDDAKPVSGSVISSDKALGIAVQDLTKRYPELGGHDLYDVEVELDRDDGRLEYEIEFHLGGCEAEYDIDALSGSILSRETDYEPSAPTGDIGAEKAKSIALLHAGVAAADVYDFELERDEDDGRLEYEIEFKSGYYEFEYTVDAATGAVLEHEKEYDD